MVAWDIDRFEQLQDSAWELDARAAEQDRNAERCGGRSQGAANRASAQLMRREAAELLAQFWAPHRFDALRTDRRHRLDAGASSSDRRRAAELHDAMADLLPDDD